MSNNNNQKEILNLTKRVYEDVINKVCQKLLDDHEENEGLAEEIIDQLKSLWKRKIEERKVYIPTELPNNQVNDGTQKKEGSTASQSKQSGSVLQPNSGKNELSEEKTQELLHNVFQQKINHPHPNSDIQGNTVKKIKTEENSNYQPPYTTSIKLEEISPNFGASDHQDEFELNRLQQENAQMTHQKPETNIEVDDFQGQHSHRNIKQEEQQIDFINAIRTDNHEDEDSEEDQIDHLEQERKKENKNELFLLQQDEHKTDCYICGYYSVMKKKTAKKFKISFEKMILSADGKDYILSGLSGDLEW